MTDYLAIPPAREMAGEVRVPASKSATNRALVAAALGREPLEIVGPLESDDTAALRRCLAAMGAEIVERAGSLSVRGPLEASAASPTTLDAADSGTAARFLAAAAAGVPGRFVLTGSPRLRERPMGDLVDALRRAGARIEYAEIEGCLPVSIDGGSLTTGTVTVDASRSSQFFSALLLAALAVDGGLTVRASGGVASAPYVGMTVQTLRDLGHDVSEDGGAIRVRRGSALASRYDVPGDYSSAVPLLAAVTAVGGRIRLTGLRWPSADADARALPVLESMGLALAGSKDGIEASAPGRAPRPVSVRASEFPGRRARARRRRGACRRPEPLRRRRPLAVQGERPRRRAGGDPDVGGSETVADGDALVVAGPAAPRPGVGRGCRRIGITAWPWRPRSSRCNSLRSSSRIPRACRSRTRRSFGISSGSAYVER